MESENYSDIENEYLWASIINAICIFADGGMFDVGNLFVITIYRGDRRMKRVSVKNCQFYASTCFESLSDCRIMNQNHKIDIIQILLPALASRSDITFQAKSVCRVICEVGEECLQDREEFLENIFGSSIQQTWIRQAFRGSRDWEMSLFRFPETHNEINTKVWGIIYYMGCNYNISTDQY